MSINKLLTIEEAAKMLNLKASRIRYEIFMKRINYFKIGRSIRFDEKELVLWALSQKREVVNV